MTPWVPFAERLEHRYEDLELEVVRFDAEDVITTSDNEVCEVVSDTCKNVYVD